MLDHVPILLYSSIICLATVAIHISMPCKQHTFYRVLIALLCIMMVHTVTTYLTQFVFKDYDYVNIGNLLGWLYPPMAYYMLKSGARNPLTKKDSLHLLPFVVVLPFFVASIFIQKMEGMDTKIYDGLVRGGMGLSYLAYLIWAINYRNPYPVGKTGIALKIVGWTVICLLSIFLVLDAVAIMLNRRDIEPRQATDVSNIFIFSCILIVVRQLYMYVVRVRPADEEKMIQERLEENPSVDEEEEFVPKEPKIDYKKYIRHVEKFITNKQYLEPSMNMEKFASMVDIPKTHLPLLFQEHYKTTFNHFINRLRIKYACKKLEDPSFSQSVDELADECGFRSRASFYRNFSHEMSCTPLEYRKKVLSDMF